MGKRTLPIARKISNTRQNKITKVAETDAETNNTLEEHEKLEDKFIHLLRTNSYTDCTFIVGITPDETRTINCHRLILATASIVFERMLYGPLAETNDIRVTDIEPDTFRVMLEFIYSGKIKEENYENSQFIKKLFIAADKYMITQLKKEVKIYLFDNLPNQALLAIDIAETFDETDLKTFALKAFNEDAINLINKNKNHFIDLSQKSLVLIVKQQHLYIQESDLIQLCYEWAIKNCDVENPDFTAYRETLGDVFQYLRFKDLRAEQFISLYKKINLFSSEEKLSILEEITTNRNKSYFDKRIGFVWKLKEVKFTIVESVQNSKNEHFPNLLMLSVKAKADSYLTGITFVKSVKNTKIFIYSSNNDPEFIASYDLSERNIRLENAYLMKDNIFYNIIILSDTCFQLGFIRNLSNSNTIAGNNKKIACVQNLCYRNYVSMSA